VEKMLDHLARGSLGAENLEEGLQCQLNLLIRIKLRLLVPIKQEPHRWRDRQFATAGLVQDPAPKPGAQKMKFRLTHGSLEPQKETVVEVVGVVKSIVVKDQSLAHRAEFEKSMPVAVIPGQARDFEAENDPSPSKADLGDQFLEPFAVPGRGPGKSHMHGSNLANDVKSKLPSQTHILEFTLEQSERDGRFQAVDIKLVSEL